MRLATLAHAISSTRPVVPSRISSIGRAFRVISSRTPAAVAVKPEPGRYAVLSSAVKRRQITSTSAAAPSRDTPGFSLPKTLRIEKTRAFWPMRRSAAARNGHAEVGM